MRSINFNYDAEGGVAESLSEILIKYYSKKGSNIHLVTSVSSENQGKMNNLLEKSLKMLASENSVVIETIENVKPLKNYRRRYSNILISDSTKNFEKICEKINYENFKIKKLFTIVLIQTLIEDEMMEIFNCLMKKLIINVNILMSDNQNVINLFTFFPFAENQKCHNTKPVKINSFDVLKKTWQNENFLPMKTKNLQKCQITFGVATKSSEPAILISKKSNGETKIDGIEYQIMFEISKRLNINSKFKLFNTSLGHLYENGTGDGVFGAAFKNEVDVILGFSSLQTIRTKFFSETTFYTIHALGIIGKINF